jgi:hypothetical protein
VGRPGVRDGALVTAALSNSARRCRFRCVDLTPTTGGEFMNETVAAHCPAHGVPYTRSRPYHKNDQAWEQQNGSIVRRFVAYRRLEGLCDRVSGVVVQEGSSKSETIKDVLNGRGVRIRCHTKSVPLRWTVTVRQLGRERAKP